MNIEQAKRIPLALILEKIGSKPVRNHGHKATYLSPIRNERTPSFQVDNAQNLWYDFGIAKGGGIIELTCAWLESQNESHTVSDALRWLGNMAGYTPAIQPIAIVDKAKANQMPLVVKKVKAIQHPALINYLTGRGIPLDIASSYVCEVLLYNKQNHKDFFALGFPNEDGGYEIRNPFFKGSIRPKTITFVRGNIPKPDNIHLFEGFMDYLSALAHHNVLKFDGDTIVLNSLSCLKFATPYIKNYGYRIAYTWMDNDEAGKKATKALADFFRTEECLQHIPKNALYEPHKDVNAWHMHNLGLAP